MFRKSDPFSEYNIKLSEFGAKLGKTAHIGHALAWFLRIKDDPSAYFVRLTENGNPKFQGYSAKALHIAKKELADPSFDISAVVAAYNNRKSVDLRPDPIETDGLTT